MRKPSRLRVAGLALVATVFALGPVLAEARPGMRGGGASSISRGGGGGGYGGGGFSGASRPSGGAASRGDYGGGGGRTSGSRDRVNSNDRANSGNVYGGDRASSGRVNNGRVNNGGVSNSGAYGGNRVNNGNINNNYNRNTNINSNNNINIDPGYGWNDHYHPIGGAIVAGAVAGAVIGSMMYTLPSGCSPYPYSGYTYYHCGSVYYETRYEGDKVVYVVVEEPG